MADANAGAMAVLALTQGYAQFNGMLPKITDIRKIDAKFDAESVADVRVAELAAFAGTMGVGIIVSSLSGSPLPAYVSLLTAVSLIAMYEFVLRADRPMEARSA